MNIRSLMSNARLFLRNNSSGILTIMSIVGVGITVNTARGDTLKAEEVLRPYDYELCPRERLRLTWKCYIPTAVSTLGTVACIVGSHYCSAKQKEALSSAYLLSQTTLQEYQKRVIDHIGENKERAIHEETVKAMADKQAPIANFLTDSKEAYITGHGNTLFYCVSSGEYFRSDINYIKNVQNEVNGLLIDGYDSLFDDNYIRISLGLPYLEVANWRGVDVNHRLQIHFSPELMDDGAVRVCMDYKTWPLEELKRR